MLSEKLIQGLTDEEVVAGRAKYGRNILKDSRRNNLSILLDVLREPMLILLAVACSVYFFTGEITEGIIMLLSIAAVAGISIYQEIRSENAVKALRKLSQPLTQVIRNGEKYFIPSDELVVGDLLIVSEGQQMAADASVLFSNDLSADESFLTGESFAVQKNVANPELFSGTTITSGLAHAVVTAIGTKTRIGQLGKEMEDIRKEKTPLQMQIQAFIKRMAFFGVIAFVFVWLYNYLDTHDVLHGLMHALTLAMAVLPEEIPVALSTFMALGAYHLIRKNVLAKHPQTVEALGSATVICVDKTGTITENKMEVTELYEQESKKIFSGEHFHSSPGCRDLIGYAMWASEPLPFDPMETAIHQAFKNSGSGISAAGFKMIKEYPLSGNPPMMTHIYSNAEGKKIIACKGAPEGIIKISHLDPEEQKYVLSVVTAFALKGLRVLAVAKADDNRGEFPEDQKNFEWKFLGLVALSDPPKKNMEEVIRHFYSAGIDVKMITGDYPVTAASIAKQVNLRNPEKILTGEQVMNMTDENLERALADVNIFARMLPEAKLRIVNALKAKGEVVAMTGDGVNDGPALKASHIGIAMGKRGTEIAHQAASLVLVNDDLSNMVDAVALGRKIYGNLKKAIQYIISIHIPLISIVTFPLILGWKFPNIFTPIHVIFFELVMGPTCSIVFENEPMEKDVMLQKPRRMSNAFFTWHELSLSIIQGVVIGAGLMVVMYYSIHTLQNENVTRALVFTTLIASNIFLTLTGRSKKYSMFTTIHYHNHLVPVVIGITSLILIFSMVLEPLRNVFGFDPVSLNQFCFCMAVAAVSVLWVELYKIKFRNRKEVTA
ncbi:MAG: cation-translocating P-type ATPase [Bacteroidetes bacterium]|nr:cation-translocating P-type ATPase [Bacteroidota bacterium]